MKNGDALQRAAEEWTDNEMDCCCDPTHWLHGTQTCFFHVDDREKLHTAFLAGAAHAAGEAEKRVRELEAALSSAYTLLGMRNPEEFKRCNWEDTVAEALRGGEKNEKV